MFVEDYQNAIKCGRRVQPTWYTRPPLMTQVYSILFPELRRGRDETYRRCELVTLTFDLETGAQCSTCRGVPSCQTDTTSIRCRFMGYWASAQWVERYVITIDRPAIAAVLLL